MESRESGTVKVLGVAGAVDRGQLLVNDAAPDETPFTPTPGDLACAIFTSTGRTLKSLLFSATMNAREILMRENVGLVR